MGVIEGVPSTLGSPAAVLDAHQSDLRTYLAALLRLRDDNPALPTGSRTPLFADDNVFVERKDADANHVLFVLNVKQQAAAIGISAALLGSAATLTDLVTGDTISAAEGRFQIRGARRDRPAALFSP